MGSASAQRGSSCSHNSFGARLKFPAALPTPNNAALPSSKPCSAPNSKARALGGPQQALTGLMLNCHQAHALGEGGGAELPTLECGGKQRVFSFRCVPWCDASPAGCEGRKRPGRLTAPTHLLVPDEQPCQRNADGLQQVAQHVQQRAAGKAWKRGPGGRCWLLLLDAQGASGNEQRGPVPHSRRTQGLQPCS